MSTWPVGAGPIALVGSGEYLPVMDHVDAALLEGRPARWVQLATAAVPDGDERLAYWHELGREAARRAGVDVVTLDVRTRVDANDPGLAALVEGAGLIYLSGGNPAFLADTLRDTAVWRAITESWRAGAALAGCSAGAMAMCGWVPSLRGGDHEGVRGLGPLAQWRVIPHYDAFFMRRLGVARRFAGRQPRDVVVFGVDEDTALVGGLDGPGEWRAMGAGTVSLLGDHTTRVLSAGQTLTPLSPFA